MVDEAPDCLLARSWANQLGGPWLLALLPEPQLLHLQISRVAPHAALDSVHCCKSLLTVASRAPEAYRCAHPPRSPSFIPKDPLRTRCWGDPRDRKRKTTCPLPS